MVVKIAHKSDAGSNKTKKHAVEINFTGYRYERPNGYKVTVTKPTIDKLALTLHVHDEHRQAIPEGLWALAKDVDTPEFMNSKAGLKGAKAYKTSVSWIDPSSKGKVLIQCQPLPKAKKNTPYLRIEFNPNMLGASGLSRFKDQVPVILLGNGSWETIIQEGRITRLDIAVDLVNVDVEDLLIRSKKPGKKMSYFGKEGKLETAYQNTTNTIYVYDKRQKLLDGKAEPVYGVAPHTRVEIRTRTTKGISGLPTLLNHLKKIRIVDIEVPNPPEEPHHWKLFQEACRYKGLDGALGALPEKIRGQYQAAIDAVEGKVWQPEKLWSFWPEAVEKTGLLDS